MAMSQVLGDTAFDKNISIFSTYQCDYNAERMDIYRKRGKAAGDLYVMRMGKPKLGKPLRDNWRINKSLFYMNDYNLKPKAGEACYFGYNRHGPFKFKEEQLCKRYLKTMENKMCMPPRLDEPLIWDNTKLPARKHKPLAPVQYVVKKDPKIVNFKDKLFLEVKPNLERHFDIHPEFRSETIKNRMKTNYWQKGTIFQEPKSTSKAKSRNITDLPI